MFIVGYFLYFLSNPVKMSAPDIRKTGHGLPAHPFTLSVGSVEYVLFNRPNTIYIYIYIYIYKASEVVLGIIVYNHIVRKKSFRITTILVKIFSVP